MYNGIEALEDTNTLNKNTFTSCMYFWDSGTGGIVEVRFGLQGALFRIAIAIHESFMGSSFTTFFLTLLLLTAIHQCSQWNFSNLGQSHHVQGTTYLFYDVVYL